MKIVCLLKVVPDTETRFQINSDSTDVVWDASIDYIMNPYDEYAVEEAIKIKESIGADVITVTIGKGEEEKSIRKAMAMGVDEGILIENPDLVNSDPLSIAKAYAEVVKPLGADIIFCGKIETDTSESFVGPAVAALLNMPVITEISGLEVSESGIVATRDASGRKEKFESSYPVVLTAEKGLNEPRYPKLPMIMKAKKKPLAKKDDAGTVIRTSVKQIKAELPPSKGAGKKLEGSIDDIVGQLVDGLQNKDKMI